MAGPQVAGPLETDPLMAARATLGSPMVGGAAFARRPQQALLNIILVPWMAFTSAGFLFLYCYHHLPVLVTLILSLWVALCVTAYVYVQRSKKQSLIVHSEAQRLSYALMLCMAAAGLGALCGYWNYIRVSGVQDYWLVGEHRQYTNVWPDELADAHRDASVLVFAKGSRPDMRMTGAFKSSTTGEKFCVAPVVAKQQDFTGELTLQYYVAGKDCCSKDEFICGDSISQDAHAGIVLQEKTDALHAVLFGRQDIDYYKEAAAMVSAKFGVRNAEQPIFLEWVANTAAAQDGFWTQARRLWLYSSALSLPLCLVAGLAAQALVATDMEKRGNRKADTAV